MSLAGKVSVVTGGPRGSAPRRRCCSPGTARASSSAAAAPSGPRQFLDPRPRRGARARLRGQADCSVEEDVERLFATVVERHGGVDKVFANAGFEHAENHADTTKEIWDRLIANDLTSSYMTCRYAIAPLRARGAGGAICVMSSMVASIAYGFAAAFIPAQAAKEAMVRNLSAELGARRDQGQRHRARLDAHAVVDPVSSSCTPAESRRARSGAPTATRSAGSPSPRRPPRQSSFLLSDDASFVTGHTLRVEGGFCSQ